MAKVNRAQEYSESQMKTAGKAKSLQMLHEGGVRFLRSALAGEGNRDTLRIRAQNIVAQLQMSLRLEEGDLSQVLLFLYGLIYDLIEKGDDPSLSNAAKLLDHVGVSLKASPLRKHSAV